MKLHGSDGRNVFEKCLSGAFFKETAEIFPADAERGSRIVKGQGIAVVFLHPVHDLGDPLEVQIPGYGVRMTIPFRVFFV